MFTLSAFNMMPVSNDIMRRTKYTMNQIVDPVKSSFNGTDGVSANKLLIYSKQETFSPKK